MASTGEGSRGWRWRPKGPRPAAERLLLYEPGNRGDLLKAAWVRAIAARIAVERHADPRARAVLDVCAGAPSYPLTDEARKRRDRAPADLRAALVSAAGDDRWPSSGLLLRHLLAGSATAGALRVFDRDPARREAWGEVAGVEVLGGESGEAVLAGHTGPPPALVLVDPYDFFHRWGPWQEPVARAAAAGPVLLYLMNKSPRGAGHRDQYRRLRAALAGSVPAPPLIGRLASDERDPRALHELWLLAPSEDLAALREPLAAATADLLPRFPGEAGLSAFEG